MSLQRRLDCVLGDAGHGRFRHSPAGDLATKIIVEHTDGVDGSTVTAGTVGFELQIPLDGFVLFRRGGDGELVTAFSADGGESYVHRLFSRINLTGAASSGAA
jgi:hypothetical protein